jgi:iron complex outermembrane receptor protein
VADTAAAVYVISADDIRRSGASNIPEALRLAPGVQVSIIGNNKWAVSIRRFADRFSNKLLVLVDGRSVYAPIFSGVLWEGLDVPLENIARIEVVRGPGASIWGANAVNGVINIITRSPFETLGDQVTVAAGSELRGYGFFRHGWSPDQDTAAALHAQVQDYSPSQRVAGGENVDTWRAGSAGFKVEHLLDQGTLYLRGGVSRSDAGDELQLVSAPPANNLIQGSERISNGFLMARWERLVDPSRNDSFQFYLDRTDFTHPMLNEKRLTTDLEYQRHQALDSGQDLIWGLGYRYSEDRIENSPMLTVNDPNSHTSLYSAYAQDEITLQPGRWRLTLGSRLEHNDYTGFGFQPNLRLLWTPDQKNSAWLSLARAIRTPSRIEEGAKLNAMADPAGPPPTLVQVSLSSLENERLDALDLGWRHVFNPGLSLDLATFYNHYDRLRGSTTTITLPPPYLLIQGQINNGDSADVYGLEPSLDWHPTPSWRLQANYSFLRIRMHTGDIPGQDPRSNDVSSPSNQYSLRSSLDLGPRWHWDAWLRHVSRIRAYDIPAYTTLDMRLAWQVDPKLKLSLVGQNLLDAAHAEFRSDFPLSTPSEVERGVFRRGSADE